MDILLPTLCMQLNLMSTIMFILGLIRCIALNPEGTWVAIGYSSGIISILDTRTGQLLASWKGHEGEVLQVRYFV